MALYDACTQHAYTTLPGACDREPAQCTVADWHYDKHSSNELCMQVRANTKKGGGEMPAVPITVRQLEAVVRISESLARMQLQVDVTEHHVQQAMDLFRTSTMDAVRAGATEGLVCNPATHLTPDLG